MSTFKDYIYSDKFPLKLWNILNCSTTKAIFWSNYGRTISIEFNSFQKEYLDSSIFKTKNIHSFIRQLNLYGFQNVKLKERDPEADLRNKSLHEYYNPLFHIINKDLAMTVKRKVRVATHKCASHSREAAGRPRPTTRSTATALKNRIKAEKWFDSHKNLIPPCEDNEEFRKSVVTKVSPKVCESRLKLSQELKLTLDEFKNLNGIPSASDDEGLLVSQVEVTPPSSAAKDVEAKARTKVPRKRRGRGVKTRANTKGKAKLRRLRCKGTSSTVPLTEPHDRLVFTELDANASNASFASSSCPSETNPLDLDQLLDDCDMTQSNVDDRFDDTFDVDMTTPDGPLGDFATYATATVLNPVVAFTQPSQQVPFNQPSEQVPFNQPPEYLPFTKPFEYVPFNEPFKQVPFKQVPFTEPSEYVPFTQPFEYVPFTQPSEQVPFTEPSEYVPFTQPSQQVPFTEPSEYVPFTEPSEYVPGTFNGSPLVSRKLGMKGYSKFSPPSSDNTSQLDVRAMPMITWEEHQEDVYNNKWISDATPEIPLMLSPSFSRFEAFDCDELSLDRYFNFPEDDIFTTMSECLEL